MNASRVPVAAAGLALFGALVVAALDRAPSAPSAAADGPAPAWAEAVEAGADHLDARALVAALAADPARVLLVDVRPADDFAAWHLRGAVNLSLPRLLGPEGAALLDARPDALVVLVSDGMTHPGQAWTELARRGRTRVRLLEDGLEGLRRGLLLPPTLRGPTTEAAAKAARDEHLLAVRVLLEPRATPAAPATVAPTPAVPAAARLATDPARLSAPTVVSAAWVARRGRDVVVLDTREKPESFAAGHVPGAVHLPIGAVRTTRDGVADEVRPVAELVAIFGGLGVDADTEVVAYADEKLQDATHAALVLALLGHRRVAVMEGGWKAWKAQGRPVETAAAPARAPRTYVPVAGADAFAVRLDAVAAAQRAGAPAILDVRPGDAFRGEVSTEARPGHIPGSLHRDHRDDVLADPSGTWWRPLSDLRAAYERLGIRPDAPVVVSCRTGHQASLTWFTLTYLLGAKDVRWYDGSWKEWAAHPELPAANPSSKAPSR